MLSAVPARAFCLTAALGAIGAFAEVTPASYGAFEIRHEISLPGTPSEIYDALTGDISGWWDHHFSERPAKLYIEPFPGGGFIECFGDGSDGARHATVIYADRGRKLTYVGPLGLSGHAIDLVITYELAPGDDAQTALKLTVSAAGRYEEGWDSAIDRVWRHFLFDRLAPWVRAGCHLPGGCKSAPAWPQAEGGSG